MNAPAKLVAFALVLGLAFGGAALAGAALDPTDPEETAVSHAGDDPRRAQTGHDDTPADPEHEGDEGRHGGGGPAAGGLAVSQAGYTLEPQRTFFEPGEPTGFSFLITDERGRPVRDEFEPEHERELHLIVVRRDTAIYQHVHPRKEADGTWSVELTLPESGVYRAYADFTIDGSGHTLATDLFVRGDFQPEPLPEPTTNDSDAGYDVELRVDGAMAKRERELTFAVSRAGQPAQNLEDYLGAKGHLVALRDGDLAYLHVHPTAGHDDQAEGHDHENEVSFAARFPSAGRYRLFLQFKTEGEIRTVAYTMEVPR